MGGEVGRSAAYHLTVAVRRICMNRLRNILFAAPRNTLDPCDRFAATGSNTVLAATSQWR